jgi:hypothetical protein
MPAIPAIWKGRNQEDDGSRPTLAKSQEDDSSRPTLAKSQ